MKHIFVATDGSDAAGRAVDEAAALSAALNIPLSIGHVLQFGRPAEELARMADVEHMVRHVNKKSGVDFANVPDTMIDLFKDTRPRDDSVRMITVIGDEIVRRATDRAKELGAEVDKTRTSQGDTADAIVDMAEDAGADVIALGHRGLGRLKTVLVGSVAQKVISHAECTVISVR